MCKYSSPYGKYFCIASLLHCNCAILFTPLVINESIAFSGVNNPLLKLKYSSFISFSKHLWNLVHNTEFDVL